MKTINKKIFTAPVSSSMLDQNIFLITSFSNTFNFCSSVKLEGHLSHAYATSAVIIVLSSIYLFLFFCGAATQRASWPPHS